jgi:UDP-N-acetyl-D-galactosamine dehydrogenase
MERVTERIAIIGLGYVGLPVALAFARKFPGTIGFDINSKKVAALRQGHDETGEIPIRELLDTRLHITDDPTELSLATCFIVAVPTPIDATNRPDLTPVLKASETVGKVLRPGSVVVYESTVFPGVTEEICGPLLARIAGLQQGVDFKLGYSPERINPGDKEHSLEKIVKVVSGEDAETLERVARAYEAIIDAGVHKAPSIKVAEAAKVIENTQRDLNIALMNELALIFDRLGIRTQDVLAAARTKWNFLPFSPGLVGGHCIGVDPYYLTTKAEEVGYHPQVILAGRRINDGMGTYIAQKMVKMLAMANPDIRIKGARVGVLGLTFKENVRDIRNSRVPDIVSELREFGIEPLVCDPLADVVEAQSEYGITLANWCDWTDLNGIILAVPHRQYLDVPIDELLLPLKAGGVFIDIKSVLEPSTLPDHVNYWSL